MLTSSPNKKLVKNVESGGTYILVLYTGISLIDSYNNKSQVHAIKLTGPKKFSLTEDRAFWKVIARNYSPDSQLHQTTY